MYDILENFCQINGWIFDYGRSDFHNLFDDVEVSTPYLFLDPIVSLDKSNDFGVLESTDYSGNFMIVLSSDFDEEDYITRYENYIKPILDNYEPLLKDYIVCNYQVTFNSWRKTEVINSLDMNFDGIIISYSVGVDV